MNDMNIDGDILMKELNLKPGPQLGKILKALFELVLEDPEINIESKLLEEQKTPSLTYVRSLSYA
jgi:hypothetical protein